MMYVLKHSLGTKKRGQNSCMRTLASTMSAKRTQEKPTLSCCSIWGRWKREEKKRVSRMFETMVNTVIWMMMLMNVRDE